ncbi:hypothetical protein BGZ99_008186 [Dissophora globulifera]|uniref:Uncharacterized protein n=1 Tax=Dissophora globulifera TaxID=979702 RepID=A0A9P6RVZ1_9FUNG|nr:hypothetical protein BGZ99_008186 [Dissophora globulifera]
MPISRPTSPASTISSTVAVLTPPQSPTSFSLKLSGSGPGSPTLHSSGLSTDSSTVIALGSPVALPSSTNPSSPSLRLLLTQPVTRTVLVLTAVHSLIALGGRFPDHCTAPSNVLYAGEYAALLASPFVVPLTPAHLESAQQALGTSILLAASNMISLALFEERLTAIFHGNGSRIFRNLFLTILVLVLGLRQLLGFIFSRALGWQLPQLFFSDSMYECNLGLAPFLFALLVVQAPFSESTASSSSTDSKSPFWSIRRIHLQVILCLFNVIPKTIVWWASSGLAVGFFVALTISYQRRMGRWGGKVKTSAFERQRWEDSDPAVIISGEEEKSIALIKEMDLNLLPQDMDIAANKGYYNDISATGPTSIKERGLSFTLWKAMTFILPLIMLLLAALIGCNQLHTYRADVPNSALNALVEPQTPFLLTLILMTAPRKNGVSYIKQTLTSYLDNFPDEAVDPLYSRIQVVVYTHFTDFAAYDEAKAYFDTIPKARKHVKWVREDGSEKNQRKHLISAIRKIGTVEDTVYLGIMEDDFKFCPGGWQQMLNTVFEANQQVPDHCGAFVATGGSGLIFKRSVALTSTFILENDVAALERGEAVSPPDISLQNCMLGKHDYCASCAGTMVISKTLLQGHLGYNTSTSGEGYHSSQFQCGWRHPFNGSPAVHVV